MALVTALGIAMSLGLVWFYESSKHGGAHHFTSSAIQGVPMRVNCFNLSEAPRAEDFELVNQYGERVRLSDHWGGLVLLSFTYTHCPDVCPLIHVSIKRMLEEPGPVREMWLNGTLVVMSVSIDPERDTVRRLRVYAEANNYTWIFLTGSRGKLERVWRAYGVVAASSGDYVSHSVNVYLVHDGRIVCSIVGGSSPDWKQLSEAVTAAAEIVRGLGRS